MLNIILLVLFISTQDLNYPNINNKPVINVKKNKIDIDLEQKKVNKNILKLKLKIQKLNGKLDSKISSNDVSEEKIKNELIKKWAKIILKSIKSNLIKKNLLDYLIMGIDIQKNSKQYNKIVNEVKWNFKNRTKDLLTLLIRKKYNKSTAITMVTKIIALIIQNLDIIILKKQYKDEIHYEYYRELSKYIKSYCNYKNKYKFLNCKKNIFKFIIRKLIRIHNGPIIDIKIDSQKNLLNKIFKNYNNNYQFNLNTKFNNLKKKYDQNLLNVDIKIKKKLNKLNNNKNKLNQVNSKLNTQR